MRGARRGQDGQAGDKGQGEVGEGQGAGGG